MCDPQHASIPIRDADRLAVKTSSCFRVKHFLRTTVPESFRPITGKVFLPRSISTVRTFMMDDLLESDTKTLLLLRRRIKQRTNPLVVSPQARREAVAAFRAAAECSERHACGQLEVLRALLRYRRRETRFAEANDRLRVRLRELAKIDAAGDIGGCMFCCSG